MSTDARNSHDAIVEQIDAPPQITDKDDILAERVEVLIRLPDLRSQQSAGKSSANRLQREDKAETVKADSNASGLLGPILETLRDRWSTWKNAAMFAQAGMLSRSLVVGGLMLGMVIAAYVLMNRREDPDGLEVDPQNTAQFPELDNSDGQVAIPLPYENNPNIDSPGTGGLPEWTPGRLDNASTGPAPRATLELETNAGNSDLVQPAIDVTRQPSRQADIYSADSRNQNGDNRTNGSRQVYAERPVARDAQRPNYERYDNSSSRGGYRDTNERFNSANQYPPAERRFPTDSRYDPRNNNSNSPNGAGFRGTIEPAPYRIR